MILPLPTQLDPLKLAENVTLKRGLNAHSTATMSRLVKVTGKPMTSVNPGNLKLIGRATFQIQSHVNHVLAQARRKKQWQKPSGYKNLLPYSDANAALFNAVAYLDKTQQTGALSAVALSIVKTLEPLRTEAMIRWEQAKALISHQPLAAYLDNVSQTSQ